MTVVTRRRLRILGIGVGGTVFGLLIGLAIAAVLATQFFGYKVLTLNSSSMSPAIEKGDITIIRPASITKVQAGDVVYVTEKSGLPLVHRVAAVNKLITVAHDGNTGKVIGQTTDFSLRTKGDANPSSDADLVTAPNFHGEVWFSIPTYGLFATSGIQPAFLMLGFAALVLLAWIAWEVRRQLKSRRRGRVAEPAPVFADVTAPREAQR